ncbi:50S ribosomal protein L4 [Lentisphaera araneosa HTCC2155]|uniref:Large ribosomal subunit protein uL4 n=1 Tax=Lentisphaera araneosa HTCC2155 TaxID=313628 RepID=A6DPN5_9BACT|nr:50S ribosomal protein L4 [Lentisphaera araneosa]EDM26330.1 50S ribosomal protein L4 [Lentisphaera araneosa HTCC2155]
MTKVNTVDSKGQASGELEINSKWLEFEKGEQAVHESVVAFLASLRSGSANTKTRSEKRGGGRKPWRQKGTGNARAGSTRSPIWTGGGVAFGPKPRSYAKNVNKKVRRLAVRRALAERIQAEELIVVDSFAFEKPSTKTAIAFLESVNAADRPVIILSDDLTENIENLENTAKSFNNVSLVMTASEVNAYDILSGKKVIITKAALEQVGQRISAEA